MAAEPLGPDHSGESGSPEPPRPASGRDAARDAEHRELLSLYANDIVLLFDDQFRLLDCNECAPAAYGYGRDEFLALTFPDLRAPENPVSLKERMAGVRGRRSMMFEGIHRRRDGSRFFVETSIRVVATESGSYYHTTVRDISGRKRLERQLDDERQRFKLLVEHCGAAILLTQPDGAVLSANPAACRMFGRTEDEIREVGRTGLVDVTDPRLAAVLAERARTGRMSGELRFLRGDGTAFPGEVSSKVFTDHLGVERTSMVIQDLSERKQAEEALKENRALLQAIIDGTSDAVYVKDAEGRYLVFNAAAELITGKRAEDVLGNDDRLLFPPDEATIIMDADRTVMDSGEPTTFEERVTDATGQRLTFLSTKGPICRDDGELLGLFGITRDITERIAAEEASREGRAKLEAALASMTDAVFISDTKGRFIDFNDAFAAFHRFGSKAECATTLAEYPEFLDVFMADGALAPLDQWAVPRALRGETGTNAEYTLRRRDTGET